MSYTLRGKPEMEDLQSSDIDDEEVGEEIMKQLLKELAKEVNY
jgi:hypothetical protein